MCDVHLFLVFTSTAPKTRKQIVLDGPVSCGKSIALSMLVHWARDEGWLVLYAPTGRDWTHGGFFYKNPETGLWDTPVQAENVLKARTFSLCKLKVFYVLFTSLSKLFPCENFEKKSLIMFRLCMSLALFVLL